jgi:hypothetical protein
VPIEDDCPEDWESADKESVFEARAEAREAAAELRARRGARRHACEVRITEDSVREVFRQTEATHATVEIVFRPRRVWSALVGFASLLERLRGLGDRLLGVLALQRELG